MWFDCTGTPDENVPDSVVRAEIAASSNKAGELFSQVDGIDISALNMSIVRAQSPVFTGFLNNGIEGCVPPGETGRQITDGYWVMLPPLSVGEHTLILHGSGFEEENGVISRSFENEVSYQLTVVK